MRGCIAASEKEEGNRCGDNDVASLPMRTKLCSAGRKRIPLIKDHRSSLQCAFFVFIGQNEKGGQREASIAMETSKTENGSKVDADAARKQHRRKGEREREKREKGEREASLCSAMCR